MEQGYKNEYRDFWMFVLMLVGLFLLAAGLADWIFWYGGPGYALVGGMLLWLWHIMWRRE